MAEGATEAKVQIVQKISNFMLEAKVEQITCEYSGSGDDGSINFLDGRDFSGNEVKIPGKIDDLLWDLIGELHPGFEINEGGGGTITLNCEEDGEVSVDVDEYNMEPVHHVRGFTVPSPNASAA